MPRSYAYLLAPTRSVPSAQLCVSEVILGWSEAGIVLGFTVIIAQQVMA